MHQGHRIIRVWFQDLCVVLFIVHFFGWLHHNLYGRYTFRVGDPALSGALIKHQATQWAAGTLNFARPRFFYPYRDATFLTENFIGVGLLLAPWAHRSVVELYHMTWWLAQATSLLCMIRLLRLWVSATWIVYLVSIVWAFNPFRVWGGQPQVQLIFDAPVLLALILWSRGYQTGRWWYWIAGGIVLPTQVYFGVYPLVAVLLSLLGALGISLVETVRRRAGIRFTDPAVKMAVALGIALFGTWVAVQPYRTMTRTFQARRPLRQVIPHSMTLRDFATLPVGLKWTEPLRTTFRSWISPYSPYPGILLLAGWLAGFAMLRKHRDIRLLMGVWLIVAVFSLGPSMRVHRRASSGIENPLWGIARQHSRLTSGIRAPHRFRIALHWLMAVQTALVLDAWWKRRGYRLRGMTPVSIGLALLLLATDMNVLVTATGEKDLSERVHRHIPSNSVVVELPSGHHRFTMVPYRAIAVATEREWWTLHGRGNILTPLSRWLWQFMHHPLRRADIRVLRAVGVTHIVLHCHAFGNARIRRRELCGLHALALARDGHFVRVWTNESDQLWVDRRPQPARMMYDRFIPSYFHIHRVHRSDGTGWALHIRPRVHVFVAFPHRCYRLTVRLSEQAHTACYTPHAFLAVPAVVSIHPVRTAQARIP